MSMASEMEKKIAHLGFIQGVINRMGQNSFLLKGWGVAIVAALFTLAAQGADQLYVLLAYIFTALLWFLDSYYLYQERLYRTLYENVASGSIGSDTFTLKTSVLESYQIDSYPRIFRSITQLPFYASIMLGAIIVAYKL